MRVGINTIDRLVKPRKQAILSNLDRVEGSEMNKFSPIPNAFVYKWDINMIVRRLVTMKRTHTCDGTESVNQDSVDKKR